MSYFESINYDYKKKEDKKGKHLVSVRNKDENVLLEVKRKGSQVEMVTYYRNQCTTRFTMPIELFENMYKDIVESNE